MQDQFLDPPVDDLRDIEFIFRRTRDLVDPAELLGLLSGAAEDAEDLAVERHLVDPAWKGVGRIQELIGTRGNADCPWRTRVLASHGFIVGYRSHPRLRIGRYRHIEFDRS